MRQSPHICIAVSLSIALVGCIKAGTFGSGSKPRPGFGVRPAEVHQAINTEPPPTTLRTLHLRIYADQDYRRQSPSWREHAREMVARASAQLEPTIGLHLTIDTMSTWDRHADPANMQAILEELRQLDAAGDMVRVVALVAALPRAAERYDECGAADLGGRHLFVRNAGDVGLYHMLQVRYHGKKLDQIYHQRLLHKELVVMLHELAHTLGATHVERDDAIMFERYATTQQAFADETIETMRHGLDDEAADKREELSDELADERGEVIRELDAAADTKDPDQALAHLEEAEATLVDLDGAADLWNRLARDYQLLSMPTLTQRALQHAGDQADASIVEWARVTRARFAIPDDGLAYGLTPASEPSYLELIRTILKQIQSGSYRDASASIRKGARRFHGAPGLDIMACDVAMRRSRWKRARSHCERALAQFEGASWDHFLLGVLDQRDGATDRARKHFTRALALDPELEPARERLAQLGH